MLLIESLTNKQNNGPSTKQPSEYVISLEEIFIFKTDFRQNEIQSDRSPSKL